MSSTLHAGVSLGHQWSIAAVTLTTDDWLQDSNSAVRRSLPIAPSAPALPFRTFSVLQLGAFSAKPIVMRENAKKPAVLRLTGFF